MFELKTAIHILVLYSLREIFDKKKTLYELANGRRF